MSHFVSRRGADFDVLQQQLLRRDPVEGPSRVALESGALSDRDKEYLLNDEEGYSGNGAAEEHGSDAGGQSSGNAWSRDRSASSSSRQRPISTASSNAASHRNSQAFGSRRNSPDSESFMMPSSRSTSPRPPAIEEQYEQSAGAGPSSSSSSANGAQPSQSTLRARNGGRYTGRALKGVTFDPDTKSGQSPDHHAEQRNGGRRWGPGKVTRSNSGFTTLEDQLTGGPDAVGRNDDGGAGSLDGQHGIHRPRTAGLISPAEVAPRKLGTWDGVFMPVSLNVSAS